MAEEIRVRIAPSPTGKLHLGTARTALFNYLFARRHGGKFILRIEDTDRQRSGESFTKDIVDGLLWLGLDWDEGPEVGGPFGPYFQQERLEIYQKFVKQLLETGQAYHCYCTPEELEASRRAQQAKGRSPKYSGRCRHLTKEEINRFQREGRKPAVRLAVESQTISFKDLIRGDLTYDGAAFGDFVFVRSDETPVFLFTNVVDDHLMEISHVLRGEDHLTNTAKQILIAQALTFLNPQFGHFPLILNPDRSKMSKRRDPVSITDDFRAEGYLSAAIINFIALLGWSSGTDREIYSLKELVNEFQLERVGKSASVFDKNKLLWMNGYYLRQAKIGEIAAAAREFIADEKLGELVDAHPDRYLQAIALVQERLKTLKEVEPSINFLLLTPEYQPELLVAKKSSREAAKKALEAARKLLPTIPRLCLDDCEVVLRHAARDNQLTDGELLWTVRVALSGRDASPGAFELLTFLGREESERRLKTALKKLVA